MAGALSGLVSRLLRFSRQQLRVAGAPGSTTGFRDGSSVASMWLGYLRRRSDVSSSDSMLGVRQRILRYCAAHRQIRGPRPGRREIHQGWILCDDAEFNVGRCELLPAQGRVLDEAGLENMVAQRETGLFVVPHQHASRRDKANVCGRVDVIWQQKDPPV